MATNRLTTALGRLARRARGMAGTDLVPRAGSGSRRGILGRIEITARDQGFEAAEEVIDRHEAPLWAHLSLLAEPTNRARALRYAERAYERSPEQRYARRVYRLARPLGHIRLPLRMLPALIKSPDGPGSQWASRQRENLRGWQNLLEGEFPMPERREQPAFEPIPAKVIYCLHNSLPHDSGGYATRSHGILQGLQRAGMSVVAYTRFGYPWDMVKRSERDGSEVAEEDVVEGIVYRRMPTLTEGRWQLPVDRYMQRSAEELERVVIAERPSLLHAASAFLSGLPTIAAARRLGIPVVYEVRGFWEVTRASRYRAWGNSEEYEAYVRLETQAALEADAVLALTNALKQELIRRGVPAERVTVVPNSVDPRRFVAMPRDRELEQRLDLAGKRVVGYVGSFVDYEGLDDLLHAAALVVDRGTDLRLLLVGHGDNFPRLQELVQDLELSEHVILPGRVPFEEVQRYYSLIDIAAFPRKPWPVTEMVSPMKPFEAMAMEKAVLVSSVDALTEFVSDGETGIVFEKGNIDSLVDALERMVRDPELCARLGKSAREWVVANRRWDQAVAAIKEVYRSVQPPLPLPDLVPIGAIETDYWLRLHNPREQERQRAVLSYAWDGRVLDIGIGPAYVACLIARAHRPDMIVGLDPEVGYVRRAQELSAANGIDGIAVVAGRGERLPFPDRSFDRVLVAQVLEHVHHPNTVIGEIARVLRPNGSALIAVPGHGKMPPGTVAGHVQDFTVAEILQEIEAAGLETIEHRTVGVREFYFVRPLAPVAGAVG